MAAFKSKKPWEGSHLPTALIIDSSKRSLCGQAHVNLPPPELGSFHSNVTHDCDLVDCGTCYQYSRITGSVKFKDTRCSARKTKPILTRKCYIVILSEAKNLPEIPDARDSSSSRLGGTPQNDDRKAGFLDGNQLQTEKGSHTDNQTNHPVHGKKAQVDPRKIFR